MEKHAGMLRKAFKILNIFMVFMWQLGMGKLLNIWPKVLGSYIVITHTGRKSGRKFQTPVNYFESDGEIYCVAGFGSISDWYRNMIANSQVEVWVMNGWFAAIAEETPISAETVSLLRGVLVNSGFAARVFGINPNLLSDEDLMEVCQSYHLMRIRRVSARTGDKGPGGYAWIWPILVILILSLRGKRRK